ncbi:MAG: arginase [Sterolibacteriaceae bacterium MAG5]|nr:arginase [Candidatus Nitricoxidireducens bremensis]
MKIAKTQPVRLPPRHARVIGVACGRGAGDPGCADGPDVLLQLGTLRDLEQTDARLRWAPTLRVDAAAGDALAAVAGICGQVAGAVEAALAEDAFPLVIGGDHSCAVGTWSGARAHLGERGELGLIWIDAHMDSHTFQTSPSHSLHGMPLACLLGRGEPALTGLRFPGPKLLPQNVCLIGVRSFEWSEAALLRTLGVRIYFMNEVRERGLAEVFGEAVAQVNRETAGYGISLDLDALDPAEEAGVGTPVPGGLHRRELLAALDSVRADRRLLAMEVVEYNPHRDADHATARTIHDFVQSLLA